MDDIDISVPNREYCQGIHVGFEKLILLASKVLLFSRQIGICLPFENGSSNGKKDRGAPLQKRT